jgi:hypothetical protein
MGCFGDIYEGEKLYGCNSSDIVPLDLPANLIEAYKYASTDDEFLRKISPFYHLDLVTAPVQIHYGVDDGKLLSGTPPEWSKKLYIGLDNLGKDVELFGYDNQLHSFKADEWFAFMERSAQFFDKYMPPPVSDRSKIGVSTTIQRRMAHNCFVIAVPPISRLTFILLPLQ